jgi:flagellar biosynthesis/type III secretory pathway M-ring protein FliF/YscJ
MRKLRNLFAVLTAVSVVMVGFVLSSGADAPSDGPSLVASAQDNLTTVLIPAIAALIGVAVLFWLAVRYFRRGTKQT